MIKTAEDTGVTGQNGSILWLEGIPNFLKCIQLAWKTINKSKYENVTLELNIKFSLINITKLKESKYKMFIFSRESLFMSMMKIKKSIGKVHKH